MESKICRILFISLAYFGLFLYVKALKGRLVTDEYLFYGKIMSAGDEQMNRLKRQISYAFELFDKGEILKSETIYLECLNEISDGMSIEYKQVLHGLGYVKCQLKKFDEARSIYNELRNLANRDGDITEESIAIHQLGMVERMAENYNEALHLFELELSLLENYSLLSDLSLATNFYEQGYVRLMKKEIVLAEEFMKKSLDHAKLSGDPICLGCSYRGLGEIYKAKVDVIAAVDYFNLAITSFRKGNDLEAVKEVEDLINL
jgi:tetratricopeptide (TPR) repeat protein